MEVDKEGNNDFWYSSRIMDQGDLSTYYGYETFDATGYSIKPGKLYPRTLKTVSELKELDAIALLKEGYAYVRSKTIPKDMLESLLPLNVISSTFELPKLQLEVGTNPTFILEKEGQPRYAIINGFLIDLVTGKSNFKNAMIYR